MRRYTGVIQGVYNALGIYNSPSNFTYLWSFGSMAFICLIIQIITGIFLSMYYKSDIGLAFGSIEYISREVYYGWLVRYIHMNGASVFFLVVYVHMLRNLLYNSYAYPRQILWVSGVIIFFCMIITAFLGYVLPWGQMSLWGATVITSIVTAVPVIGLDVVEWLWGGFSVDDATLNRFYSLHFLFPFIILGLSIVHIILLHEFGSNNPIGISAKQDSINFFPGYIIKDMYSWFMLFIFMGILVFFMPNLLGHPDNYILGNALVTPTHIVPEWYFLPLYAILRSIPSKLMGLVVLVFAILTLVLLPWIVGSVLLVRSIYFKPFLKYVMVIVVINCLLLGWVGGKPVEAPYYTIGQIVTFMYFVLFYSLFFINIIEFVVGWSYTYILGKNNE